VLDNETTVPPTDPADDQTDDQTDRTGIARWALGVPRLMSAAALGPTVIGVAGLVVAVGAVVGGLDAVSGLDAVGIDEITCCPPNHQ